MAREPKICACFRGRDEWISALKAQDFSVEQGHFPSRGGGLTAYTLFQISRENPLTILIHGTGNDHLFTFQPLIEALLAIGQNVLSFDLIGHGHESSTELCEKEFWQAAEDLKKFLEYKNFNTKNLNAVAYSLGGLFLLNAIDQKFLQPNRLVLLAVPLRAKVTLGFIVNEFLSLFTKPFHEQRRRYGWLETLPAFGAFRREEFPLRLPESYRKSYPQFVDDLLQKKPPPSLLGKLGQNCLVITGSKDKLARPEDLEKWREANPELKLVTVDRANHFLLPFHEATLELITHWISK